MSRPASGFSRLLTLVLCIGAIAVVSPLWTPIVLAAWLADLLRPSVLRFEKFLGGRRRAAGALMVLVAVGMLLPFAGITLAIVSSARELFEQVTASLEGRGSLASSLLGDNGVTTHPSANDWASLASRYGEKAWLALRTVLHASASAAIGVVVFAVSLYSFAVDTERARAWVETQVPLPRETLVRLWGAFRETGRGLIVAGGGTALVQGALATVAYAALGIPRAIILGPVTGLCAIVPLIGTGLVWLPLSINLAVHGHYLRAGILVAVGASVLGLVDNFIRPILARFGRLRLPASVVLVSMLGGVAVFGPTGVILGPLVMRLCVEALAIATEQRSAAAGADH